MTIIIASCWGNGDILRQYHTICLDAIVYYVLHMHYKLFSQIASFLGPRATTRTHFVAKFYSFLATFARSASSLMICDGITIFDIWKTRRLFQISLWNSAKSILYQPVAHFHCVATWTFLCRTPKFF